jgi:hypothetical protein
MKGGCLIDVIQAMKVICTQALESNKGSLEDQRGGERYAQKLWDGVVRQSWNER